jgi:hypothetical protein
VTKPTNVVTLDISDVTKANIQSIHNKGQIAVCTFSAGTVTQEDNDMCVWHASAPNGLSQQKLMAAFSVHRVLFANADGLVGSAAEPWPAEMWLDVMKQAALLV